MSTSTEIKVSEVSVISVSWVADQRGEKLVYSVLDFNPVYKKTESIMYCYVNPKNGKISHNLDDKYDNKVITKIVKIIMENYENIKKLTKAK